VKVIFSARGWSEYLHWSRNDARIQERVNEIIEDIRRHPFTCLGKPEPLRGSLHGFWARRITGEHRLVYCVEGKGDNQAVAIAQCRYHY
jgi:toxin YoeB